MESILQGSNAPIVLEIEGISKEVKISAVLTAYGKTLKTWTYNDMTIQGDYLILPLTEVETLNFSRGVSTLDIKALDNAGNIVFMDLVEYRIIERDNKTKLTGG